jgi:hypothetical protein
MESHSTSIDILTMDGASGGSEDFIVFRTNAETELSYIDSGGSIVMPGSMAGLILNTKGAVGQTTFQRVRLPILSTAPASAGLTKGDIWLAMVNTADQYRMAVCVSTATGDVRYDAILNRVTLGTVSH